MHDRARCSLIVLLGGIVGVLTGFGLQDWVSAIAYPLNIGGKPFISWPAFIPVTFELTILFAALAAVLGMLVLNGLPMPYHPVFNVERFATHASHDRFFLASRRPTRSSIAGATLEFLKALEAKRNQRGGAVVGRGAPTRSAFGACCALCLSSSALPAGHAQPAEVPRPLRASAFFADGSSARPLVEGTVARGTLQDDEAFFTGKNGGAEVDRAAVPG